MSCIRARQLSINACVIALLDEFLSDSKGVLVKRFESLICVKPLITFDDIARKC